MGLQRTDNGYESMQDFFISWTIRCAVERFKSENLNLNLYAKRILYALIFCKNDKTNLMLSRDDFDDFEVVSVVTKRQEALIDLMAEVHYKIRGNPQRCILNIENKWYSSIRPFQLENSYKFIRQIYDIEIIDIVLFCDSEKISEEVKLHCAYNSYKYLTVEDLQEFSGITLENRTENALFDEYWLNF